MNCVGSEEGVHANTDTRTHGRRTHARAHTHSHTDAHPVEENQAANED